MRRPSAIVIGIVVLLVLIAGTLLVAAELGDLGRGGIEGLAA
jgi:hypothetical protein